MKSPKDFWKQVEIKGKKDCWNWLGGTVRKGYGATKYQGKTWRSHRLAWFLANGKIPEGLDVLHTCDNPPCCNPNHLFLGTNKDNIKDMIQKGRQYYLSGENHPRAKLSSSDIDQIRLMRNVGMTCAFIGKVFGVKKSHISHIANYKARILG